MRQYYVYILASQSRRLYVGITSDLIRRVFEHRSKVVEGFTSRYNITRLVYFESTDSPYVAISREKQIKGLLRSKKVRLIQTGNPQWRDLYDDVSSCTPSS